MFTTRHQSENGILSLVVALLSLSVLIGSIVFSFLHRGSVPAKFGGVALFAALADIIGIIAGSVSLKEKDIFIWMPRVGLIANIVLLLLWALTVVIGLIFGG